MWRILPSSICVQLVYVSSWRKIAISLRTRPGPVLAWGSECNRLITTIRLGASPDREIIGTERRAMLNTEPRGFLYRVIAVVAGFTIVGFGLAPILKRGDLFSTNWFGELVFAPLAIVLGLVVVAFALFKPDWLSVERVERKSRQ